MRIVLEDLNVTRIRRYFKSKTFHPYSTWQFQLSVCESRKYRHTV